MGKPLPWQAKQAWRDGLKNELAALSRLGAVEARQDQGCLSLIGEQLRGTVSQTGDSRPKPHHFGGREAGFASLSTLSPEVVADLDI